MDKNNLNIEKTLKATIEANRISRLPKKAQKKICETLNQKKKVATGIEKHRLDTLIGIITEKQEKAKEAYENQTYAEYGGGFINSAGGDGRENG
jgi:putative cell wall-binding protein